LMQPNAYEALKQALRARRVRFEPPNRGASLVSTRSLDPEPIPLDVKVVIIGDRNLYYQLCQLEPDFGELFKVAADFDEQIERSDENNALYARLVATLARAEKLKPLDCAGVARALEYSARQAGDSERLSTRLESLADLLREADYWAAKNGNGRIGGDDVQRATQLWAEQLPSAMQQVERELEELERAIIEHDLGPELLDDLAAIEHRVRRLRSLHTTLMNRTNVKLSRPTAGR